MSNDPLKISGMRLITVDELDADDLVPLVLIPAEDDDDGRNENVVMTLDDFQDLIGHPTAVDWDELEEVPVNVTALAGLTGAADRIPFFSALGAMAVAAFTSFARTLTALTDLAGLHALVGRGTAGGLASLDGSGKVPTSQLPDALLGAMSFQDFWNAFTNTPFISPAAPENKGWYYIVQTAGTTDVDGIVDWKVGDWIVSNGERWDKIDNTDAVISVAGLTGSIDAASLKLALSLGSAAAASTGDFATAAQGDKADSAVQSGDLADVATSGQYDDLIGTPTLGTAAAQDVSAFAAASHTHPASDITGLATVATTGSYSSLTGTPSLGDAAGYGVSNDATLAGDSTTALVTEHAVKSALAQFIAANDVLSFKGVIDCSASPNYPNADAGHVYRVSVAGKIGGASGPKVEFNDLLTCLVDSSSSGDQASVGANWVISQTNIDGAVVGPTSAVDRRLAVFDGTSGTSIADGGIDVDDVLTVHSTTANLSESNDRNYVTDAEKTKLSNLSGTNTGDQTTITGNAGTATALQTARNIDGQAFDGTGNITVIAPGTHAASSKSTPVNADEIPLVDSAASNVLKKLTWANLKATLKTYFDTLYVSISGALGTPSSGTLTNCTGLPIGTGVSGLGTGVATFLGTPSSANLAAALTDETGTGTVVFSSAIRERLTGNRTYYVRTDGSNSNNGLANTSGGAWLTLQYAHDWIANNIDPAGYVVTVQIGAGTYTSPLWVYGAVAGTPSAGSSIQFVGDTTTPSNVVLSTSGVCVLATYRGTVIISGVKFVSSGGDCVYASGGGVISIPGKVEFGSAAGYHMHANGGVIVVPGLSYIISGGAQAHYYSEKNAFLELNSTAVTVSGTPAFSLAFALAGGGGYLIHAGCTFTGSATGPKYIAFEYGIINTGGGGANYFPGNSGGTATTGTYK